MDGTGKPTLSKQDVRRLSHGVCGRSSYPGRGHGGGGLQAERSVDFLGLTGWVLVQGRVTALEQCLLDAGKQFPERRSLQRPVLTEYGLGSPRLLITRAENKSVAL